MNFLSGLLALENIVWGSVFLLFVVTGLGINQIKDKKEHRQEIRKLKKLHQDMRIINDTITFSLLLTLARMGVFLI